MAVFHRLIIEFYKGNYKRLAFLPIILFFVLLYAAFFYPGLSQGIDLKGGNLILISSSGQADTKAIQAALISKFDLDDVLVTSIISPTNPGIVIQFSKNKFLYENEVLLKEASAFLKQGNAPEASARLNTLLDNLSQKIPITDKPSDAAELFDFAASKLEETKQQFYDEIQALIKQQLNTDKIAFQIKEVAPTIGAIFWNNALFVALISIVGILIVIFLFFREVIPSLAIILAASFDVVTALGLMAIFGIPLSISTIPALLMIVGYSIDTDILITTRILKHKELNPRSQASKSMVTGLTMTGTTLTAVFVMSMLSYTFQMFVIYEIAVVLLFGLIGDLISTWFMNGPILIWYAERQGKKVVA